MILELIKRTGQGPRLGPNDAVKGVGVRAIIAIFFSLAMIMALYFLAK